jgi:hypothetical protein
MKRCVVSLPELGPLIGVMQVHDDIGWVEQHDQMLGEVAQRINPKIGLGQADRSCLCDPEGGTHDADVHVRQILRRMHVG